MATQPGTDTATAESSPTKLKLDPPEMLQPVAAAEASGLVPLKSEEPNWTPTARSLARRSIS